MNKDLTLLEKTFSEEAYSTAHRIGMSLMQAGNTSGEVFLYTTLAEIGMSKISEVNVSSFKSDFSFAIGQLTLDSLSVQEIEDIFKKTLQICSTITKTLTANYQAEDDMLKSKYQGSSGISLDSNDPTDRQKQDRERAINNSINEERHGLKEKYHTLVKTIFSCVISTITLDKQLLVNKHLVSLEFLKVLVKCSGYVDHQMKHELDSFVRDIKESRNEYYWQKNDGLRKALLEEKRELSEQVDRILNTQITDAQNIMDECTDIIKVNRKERKRFSLFNQTDRKPLSEMISSAKKKKKENLSKLKELNAGICIECDPLRKRIAEIDEVLSKQY